jgi:hypothetical protein
MTPVMYWILGALAGAMVTFLVMFWVMSALVEDHCAAMDAMTSGAKHATHPKCQTKSAR